MVDSEPVLHSRTMHTALKSSRYLEQILKVPTTHSSLGNTRKPLSILFKYKALW